MADITDLSFWILSRIFSHFFVASHPHPNIHTAFLSFTLPVYFLSCSTSFLWCNCTFACVCLLCALVCFGLHPPALKGYIVTQSVLMWSLTECLSCMTKNVNHNPKKNAYSEQFIRLLCQPVWNIVFKANNTPADGILVVLKLWFMDSCPYR